MIELERVVAGNAPVIPADPILDPVKQMVGLAGFEAGNDPNLLFCTSPFGSGLGVVLHDPVAKAGGVLHGLLPASGLDPRKAAAHPALFLDTGLDALLARMRQLGSGANNICAYAAGAAQIMDEDPAFSIGRTNCDALAAWLEKHGIPLHAQALGGRTTCSLEFSLGTGEVWLRYSGQPKATRLCTP